jgi:1,4-alpha-glucan branching enzyme
MRIQDFYAGREFFAHTWLGAHLEGDGTVFRTYAPAADGIVVHMDGGDHEMHRIEDGNFWEARVRGAMSGTAYEYRIYRDGEYVDHADPYGFGMDLRPAHRSIVRELGYAWHDDGWMRARTPRLDGPLNIYEMHVGSWRKRRDQTDAPSVLDWYNYAELADELVPYLLEAGFTHVEFLPLSEHPLDASWGYQPTGFFAPTSRYGTAQQLMYLVDRLHQAGIGAIIDFVPAHFATDAYALANYDGSPLFEHSDQDRRLTEWGTYVFDHSRGETRSFLQSAANFWLGTFHFDGIRIDAVSHIVYWQGDERRGVNGAGVDFLRHMNVGLKYLNPGVMLAAEDSTNYHGTTASAFDGGLGFDYKWDMGWMHDTLEMFQTGPSYRSRDYHKLSFSMMYFKNARYMLPLSHDEVVHCKATVAQKMWGDYDNKFPQARTLYLYMFAHPGKKLNFMGSEIAQLREWDENRAQDWGLRTYPLHDSFYAFCRELNAVYREHPALWAGDYERGSFEWRQVSDNKDVVYAFERRGGDERMVCVLNLSDAKRWDYGVWVPGAKRTMPLIDTDWQRFSGSDPNQAQEWHEVYDETLRVTLAPFSGQLLLIE